MSSTNLSSIFKHQTEHNSAILELLENTTIGTNGAKYQHLHTAKKIADLHQPHYFTIYRHEKAIANVTICERPMLVNNQLADTSYIRYFAFSSAFQTKEKAKERKHPSIFQEYVSRLLSTSNLNVENPEHDSKIYWAIVDPENERSLQMGERYGFETITKIKTIAFSRFNLKQQAQVVRLNASEENGVRSQIQQFYKGYNNISDVHLFENNNYFVLKVNNKIIAGIQANVVEWKIEALPGIIGTVLVKTLPHIPYLKRIINPKKYKFLATEGLFWIPGHQDKIRPLLEGVLYQQNCHSMLLWADGKDTRLNTALKKSRLGWLQKLKTDNPVNLVAKFNNMPDGFVKTMKDQLHYISGFDCT
ncbi:MAG: hypothetical protein AB8B74_00525 [Crocinitomicaceae bacterium]